MNVVSSHELYDFFAHLGEAVYAIQVVEGSLHQILSIRLDFATQRRTQSEANKILERYRAKTLGGLLAIAEKSELFPEQLAIELKAFNSDRRWLIHRLQEDTELRFRADPAQRHEVLKKVSSIAEQGYRLNTLLTENLVENIPKDLLRSEKFSRQYRQNLARAGFTK